MRDIQNVLRAGADKVSINTAAVRNPSFINQATRLYGSSTIVIAMECLRKNDGDYYIFTDNGREETGKEALNWASEVESRGAGEIFLTSIDKEGTGKGFDTELISKISKNVSIPVIAHGGASKYDHIKDAVLSGKADAVSIASMLHYGIASLIKSEQENAEGNIEFLKSNSNYKKFEKVEIISLKQMMIQDGINVRH